MPPASSSWTPILICVVVVVDLLSHNTLLLTNLDPTGQTSSWLEISLGASQADEEEVWGRRP